MFISAVSTKNVWKNRNDIEIRNTRINPIIPDTRLSILCTGPLVSEVRWETAVGNVLQIQGLPPFFVFDDGNTYFPLPAMVQIAAVILPHPHWLINWTRNTRIIVQHNFEFVYTSPQTGVITRFDTLFLQTQIQAATSAVST